LNKYIEIIRSGILDVICSQPYPDSLDENGVINIFDVVFESLGYINESWVDQREHEEFIEILAKFDNGKNPCVIEMLKNIEAYHKETLEQCAQDPTLKKFDHGMDGGE